MPITVAIDAYSNTHFDQFTARCRVSKDIIISRPSSMSNYLLYTPIESQQKTFICRAALQSTACVYHNGSWAHDKSIILPPTHASNDEQLEWIPRNKIQDAVGIMLCPYQLDALENTDDTLLDSAGYKQYLQNIIQHQYLVCKNALLVLPVPKQMKNKRFDTNASRGYDSLSTIQFQVENVIPDNSSCPFVRITHKTRITFAKGMGTKENEERSNLHQGDKLNEVNTNDVIEPIGGLEMEQSLLRDMILFPIQYKSMQETFGLSFPKGLLLYGPPGVGKTLLVRSVIASCASQVDINLNIINGAEIITGTIGDAEESLRKIFQQANAYIASSEEKGGGNKPRASLIFIDEIDALCPKRDNLMGNSTSNTTSRIVAQLLTLLDGVDESQRSAAVIVVAATNLPNSVDIALRRPGRFEKELYIPPPDVQTRDLIFQSHLQSIPLGSISIKDMASILSKLAIGYVGADIAAVCREALAIARSQQLVRLTNGNAPREKTVDFSAYSVIKEDVLGPRVAQIAGNAWRVNPLAMPLWFIVFTSSVLNGQSESDYNSTAQSILSQEKNFHVTLSDFEDAMKLVGASSLRSATGHLTTKNASKAAWNNIGGHNKVKIALQQVLEWPLAYPDTFKRLGIKAPRGILLYGPPGTSKSTLVRAAAEVSGVSFLSLSPATVFSQYVGEAEATIRRTFAQARAAIPAILFLDELDVLVTKREFSTSSSGSTSNSNSSLRILSTLLNEMDGVEITDGLLVLAATNRPEMIDAALLRPGRFDRILYVGLPETIQDRYEILQIHTSNMEIEETIMSRKDILMEIAQDTKNYSGAELESICREAAFHALREDIKRTSVNQHHFQAALSTIKPLSNPQSLQLYQDFQHRVQNNIK